MNQPLVIVCLPRTTTDAQAVSMMHRTRRNNWTVENKTECDCEDKKDKHKHVHFWMRKLW